MAGQERNISVGIQDADPNADEVGVDEHGVDQTEMDGTRASENNNTNVGDCNQWRMQGLKLRRRQMLQRQRSYTQLAREEAWLRRRRERLCEEESSRAVSRSVSDCGERGWSHARARCLRDEDLEELRGCIDLGFRFSVDEDHDHDELCNTFPALDLYYAINRQFNVSKSKSSPESSVHGSELSPSSPLCDTWRISSPGENSQEVKTKLRHWAQLVACSVRQSC